eukprot:gnl/TRDRNA2_/TRDRNA2_75114_c0_seq1.p2 gnl/TRDRNA2_/TRDRNA2_75114_c0~~gnl/TRDRNA2_/TRDRNA2_75114_c0_seq1.p2  ORF type:complete len:140 (+),score=11.66 gnl/TRDRNA2_/TRDRNA2_75114_c0_seq1:1-420(+)
MFHNPLFSQTTAAVALFFPCKAPIGGSLSPPTGAIKRTNQCDEEQSKKCTTLAPYGAISDRMSALHLFSNRTLTETSQVLVAAAAALQLLIGRSCFGCLLCSPPDAIPLRFGRLRAVPMPKVAIRTFSRICTAARCVKP